MPSGVYGVAKYRVGTGAFQWAGSFVRVLLVGPTYTFSNAHRVVADLLGHEVSDPSYARQTLGGRAVQYDIPLQRGLFDAEPTRFQELDGVSVAGAVLYERGGADDSTPTDDFLICYLEFPSTFVADGTDLLVRYDAAGIITLT